MKKKETTNSILKEIRDLLKESLKKEVSGVEVPKDENFVTIDFPNKTAKEIVEDCNNKLGEGKLLFNTSWYENEDFYAKEKCRPGKRLVSKELIGLGKDWNECKKLAEEKGGDMLNYAETIFFIKEHFKLTGKYPWNLKYSWTSSSSSRGYLVNVGYGDADGVFVVDDSPRYSASDLGLCFSRTI